MRCSGHVESAQRSALIEEACDAAGIAAKHLLRFAQRIARLAVDFDRYKRGAPRKLAITHRQRRFMRPIPAAVSRELNLAKPKRASAGGVRFGVRSKPIDRNGTRYPTARRVGWLAGRG